jgi:uncharacterized membrane protein
MESRAKLLGHPVHQMLIVFPLGLLAMAVIFDLLAIGLGSGYWSEISYWMIAAGVVTGLLAAPFGFIDWLAIPAGTRAKRIGAVHGLGNVAVVVMFGLSWWLRSPAPNARRLFRWPSPSRRAGSRCSPGGSAASSSIGWRSAWTKAHTSTRRAR